MVASNQKKQNLAQIVWGLNWEEHLPAKLGEYTLEKSDIREFLSLKSHPESFFITSDSSNDSFVKDQEATYKENFLEHVSDFFVIKNDQKVIGVVVCEIRDWSTYYLRYITISKDHRQHNLTKMFLHFVESVLRIYPLDKITCDVSPANLKQISRMSEMGYVYTGNILSERFGASVQLTRFLQEKSWTVYNKNFMQSFYSHQNESNEAFVKHVKEYV